VPLHRVERHDQPLGDLQVRATLGDQVQHLAFPFCQRLDQDRAAGAAHHRRRQRGRFGRDGVQQPSHVVHVDYGRPVSTSPRRHQTPQEAGQARALVAEDTNVALRLGERERVGEGVERARRVGGYVEREGLQQPDLDDAADSSRSLGVGV
jgi:hypothetical protein